MTSLIVKPTGIHVNEFPEKSRYNDSAEWVENGLNDVAQNHYEVKYKQAIDTAVLCADQVQAQDMIFQYLVDNPSVKAKHDHPYPIPNLRFTVETEEVSNGMFIMNREVAILSLEETKEESQEELWWALLTLLETLDSSEKTTIPELMKQFSIKRNPL